MKTKTKKLKIAVGEWCFCEFKLQEILEVSNGRITSVSDGVISMGGDSTDCCFPLGRDIKRISDSVHYWHKKFHASALVGLNHPDLNRKLISMWVDMCKNKDNQTELKRLYIELDEFVKAVWLKIKQTEEASVCGVKLFREVRN